MNTAMKQVAPNDNKYVERSLEKNGDQQHGVKEEEEQKRTSKLGCGIIEKYLVNSLLFSAAFVAIIVATTLLASDFKNWSDGNGSDNDTVATQTVTAVTTLPIVIPLNRCYDVQWSPPGHPMLDTYSLSVPYNDRFVDGEYVFLEDKRDGYYTFKINMDGKITGFVRTNDDTGSITEVFNEVEFIAISEDVLFFNGDPTGSVLGGGYGTIIKGSNIPAGPADRAYETTSVEDSSNNVSPEEWLLKYFHNDLPLSLDTSGDESKDGSHNDYDTASTGWRIYTTPQDIPNVDWAWDVQELEFYENLDCTTKISTNTGMPIDSGNAGPGWTANNAFGGGTWGGRQDQNGVFWIGMSFQEVVTVKCIRIQNIDGYSDKAANEIQIQASNTNVNEWETVWIARGLDTSGSAWNTISLDFPSGDNPDDEVTTQTMVPSSTIIKRYKSEEGGDGIWYQFTSKPATASAIDYSTDYYNQLCQEEFGSGSWIVDWSNDLKFLHKRNEIENLLTALGIDDPTFNESCFFVTENGADFYGDNRKYFFENHGGNPPNNWLVHDQLGDISLGSWYGIEGKVLCKYCDENAAPCYN